MKLALSNLKPKEMGEGSKLVFDEMETDIIASVAKTNNNSNKLVLGEMMREEEI